MYDLFKTILTSLTNTNCDEDLVGIPIPTNDDAMVTHQGRGRVINDYFPSHSHILVTHQQIFNTKTERTVLFHPVLERKGFIHSYSL